VVVAHEHTWSFQGQPLRRLLDRSVVARAADVVLAVSREDRRRMIEIERIPPDRVKFLANGIGPLPAPTHDVRAELGIPAAAPVIGTVGVMRAQKALEVLLAATRLLAPELPALRVLVAGDGPERPRLERLLEAWGLERSVTLLGVRRDIADVLAALDVAVCCSDFEGSPLSVMEYMAAAKPVVATAVGGVPDLLEQGVHGLLVSPRDPRALADAVAALLADPTRAARMGALGRERQAREFTLDAMVARVERVYESLYARRG